MMKINLTIDTSERIAKCQSHAVDMIKHSELLESLTSAQRNEIEDIFTNALDKHFANIQINMVEV